MARYVDGFLLAAPKRKLDAYRKLARKAGKIWMEHGALAYVECASDDLKPRWSGVFRRGVRLKPGEKIIFSWIVYKSRAHRDRVGAKVMKDPRLADLADPKNLPFDMKRMGWAGFKTLVDL
jgi:uncharacterized protein YbaA (DUF1428 family)